MRIPGREKINVFEVLVFKVVNLKDPIVHRERLLALLPQGWDLLGKAFE